LWAACIPSCYEDRKTPYSTADLVTLWQDNGKPPIEVAGGGAITIKYALREHPEIAVYDMPYALPPPPYLYVSFHWPLEQDQWDVHHIDRLRQNGYKTTLLAQRPAKYMRSWDYPTSLYFPPNGFWVYKVTAQ
jgi:hypothetical protein